MSYQQIGEPKFTCLKCNKIWSLNHSQVQYGLFRDGLLMRCSECFEKLKHNFWLKQLEQE